MSSDLVTWIWLAGGVVLISAEVAWPHFYASFFGLAALLVALLRKLGLLYGLSESLVVWFLTSVILLVTLRHLAIKHLHSEKSYHLTDEDVEAAGEIVEVVTTVSDQDEKGRIRFRGTTWPAVCREGTILAGQKARLLYRDNLVWKVESYEGLENQEKSSVPVIRNGESSS